MSSEGAHNEEVASLWNGEDANQFADNARTAIHDKLLEDIAEAVERRYN